MFDINNIYIISKMGNYYRNKINSLKCHLLSSLHTVLHRRYVNPCLDIQRGKHLSPKVDSVKSHFVMPSVEVRNEMRNSVVGGRLPLP